MEHQSVLATVHARLGALKLSDLDAVAAGSGVPISTIRKLRYGEVTNPRVNTAQALYDYFQANAEPTPSDKAAA